MRAERTDYAYVDITVSGVTVSVPRTDTDAIERILRKGAGEAPLSALTEPYREGDFVSGSIVVDEGPEASSQAETIGRFIEETLREEGYETIT